MKTATTATSAYVSPKIRTIEIDIQDILCYSGNEPMREEDLGDGGFTNI